MDKIQPSDQQRHNNDAHDNDRRGEHRYPDSQQSESEQASRQNRDDLKERLGRQVHKGATRNTRPD